MYGYLFNIFFSFQIIYICTDIVHIFECTYLIQYQLFAFTKKEKRKSKNWINSQMRFFHFFLHLIPSVLCYLEFEKDRKEKSKWARQGDKGYVNFFFFSKNPWGGGYEEGKAKRRKKMKIKNSKWLAEQLRQTSSSLNKFKFLNGNFFYI